MIPDITTLTLLVIVSLMILALVLAALSLSYEAANARLPAATRFVDVEHRLRIAEEELDRRQGALREVEQTISERDHLAAEVEVLRQMVAALKLELDNLAPARVEIEQVKREAAEAAGALAEANQQLAGLADERERVRAELDPDRIERLRRERTDMEAELARVHGELAPLRAEADAARRSIAEAGAVQEHVGAAQARIEALKLEAVRLEEGLGDLLDDTDKARDAHGHAVAERDTARQQRDAATAERDGVLADRDRVADDRIRLEARVAELDARAAALDGATAGPEGGVGPSRGEILADLLVAPAALAAPATRRDVPRPETQALSQVSEYLKDSGLHFSRRTLHAFHTALKINDAAQLTVLAGVSGTGKSVLPRRYAEALGIHFLQVAVEPRWDSPQDLLGFYNYVEKKYRATELARLLAHFDPWGSFPLPKDAPVRRDHMALVLLDEMNLARVEYYFSEFLSRLEARPAWSRDLSPDKCKDALIPVDIRGLNNAPSLFPAHNILFVGTMNDDESTQSLSDKVLDRGNILQFPAPIDFEPPKDLRNAAVVAPDAQSFTEWRRWRQPKPLEGGAETQTRDTIRSLAQLMQDFGRPFGHRLNQAIRAYVQTYPSEGNAGPNVAMPLADQIELRILPRLRGIPVDDHQQEFETLAALVETKLGDTELAKQLLETVEAQNGTGLFVWRGLTRR